MSGIAQILVKSCTEESIKILITLSSNTDYLVRANACDSLGIFADDETLEWLMRIAQKDERDLVRSYALLSAADIMVNCNRNGRVFQKILEHAISDRVRLATLRSLCLLGYTDSLDQLINELKSDDYSIRCFCVNMLADVLNDDNRDKIIQSTKYFKEYENSRAVISCMNEVLKMQ